MGSAPDSQTLDWATLFVAAIGGGFVVKILDIVYLEIRRRLDRKHSAKSLVDQHFDPLLKSADELVGKLHSLGREDFRSFEGVGLNDPFSHADFGSTTYLFARFWAQIEILRLQAPFAEVAQEERGRHLQAFLDCLESRHVRLVDRINQRAVGETLMAKAGTATTLGYIEFVEAFRDGRIAEWLLPLTEILASSTHTSQRQSLLQYAVVVHAMIDTLDPKHSVTRERPATPTKLSKQTWRGLRYRVFGTYLKFVRSTEKYIGRPRDSGGRRGKATR